MLSFRLLPLNRARRQKLIRLLAVGIVIAVGATLVWTEPPWLLQWRERVWDRFVELKPRDYDPSLKVRIVDIDDASLAAHGQWPWPRSRMARLVSALDGYGVHVIAFDVIFGEPDRTSLPQVFGALQKDVPGYRPPLSDAEIAAQPDNDAILAAAIAELPVVLGVSLAKSTALGVAAPDRRLENLPRVKFERRRDKQSYLLRADSANSSLTMLQKAAASNAVLDMRTGSDGVTRWIPILLNVGRRTVPGLPAATVALLEGEGISAETRRPGLRSITIGSHVVPTDRHGLMRLYDSGSQKARYISAAEVLSGRVPAAALKDAVVVIGTSVEGLHDLRLTPLSNWSPGMETHVQAIEQILSDIHLTRPDVATLAETGALVMAGLIVMLAVWGGWSILPPWAVAVVASGGAVAVAWIGFAERMVLLDPTPLMATLLLAAALERFLLVLDLRRERSQVRGAFSRYLAPALVEQLAQDPDRLRLGGEMREMTFLFCDVRGFTAISEQFDPEGLTRLINRFLTPMTDVIMARNGTIDKYMGDCIMAFWNAPLADTSHARHACDAALAMQRELALLNEDLAAEADAEGRPATPLQIGIGLNTGGCVVGNMGSQQRFDYSVLGDAVNLASRLEGQSKTYGVGILIGEETHRAAPEYAVLELDLIAVKGRAAAARIFALMGDGELAADPAFRNLAAAQDSLLAAYRGQDWSVAREQLATCRGIAAGRWALDGLYALYAARLDEFEANPPGPDWDGVYVAVTK